ncbi:MAG: hypothetical protein HKP40_03345 [Litoreibacter sp.]|nr:hypothetical protein [Litoreibacter sp.]
MYAQEKRSDFRIERLDDFNRKGLGTRSSDLPELRSQCDLEIDEFRPLDASALRNGVQGLLRTLTFNGAVPLFVPVMLVVVLPLALVAG